jgi:hypothetical protein
MTLVMTVTRDVPPHDRQQLTYGLPVVQRALLQAYRDIVLDKLRAEENVPDDLPMSAVAFWCHPGEGEEDGLWLMASTRIA